MFDINNLDREIELDFRRFLRKYNIENWNRLQEIAEIVMIKNAISKTAGRRPAARMLGIGSSTLYRKMTRYGFEVQKRGDLESWEVRDVPKMPIQQGVPKGYESGCSTG